MRVLLPEPATDNSADDSADRAGVDVDLHAHYAAGWSGTGGVRVNFIAAVDGAAQADGKSGGLQTPGDNAVFAALRDLADIVLAGAGTVVAEGYAPIELSEHRTDTRRRYGFAPSLPTAVISRTLRGLTPDRPLFAAAAPDNRTVVLTSCAAPAEQRAALAAVADVAVCGVDRVEPAAARAALNERGHRRILCEGGPTVFAEFAADDALDELCLSVAPLLAGPGAGRITAGAQWAAAWPLRLIGLLEEDGALFTRYRTRPVPRP